MGGNSKLLVGTVMRSEMLVSDGAPHIRVAKLTIEAEREKTLGGRAINQGIMRQCHP